MTAPRHFDVAIIGGGPAGSAAAITLARGGAQTVVVERTDYSSARIGETLPPPIRRPLTTLGLWDRFVAAGHVESLAIRSAWGSREPRENEHILSPYGKGWHIDRAGFDRMLADAAESSGATVLTEARIEETTHEDGGWRLTVARSGQRQSLTAGFLIDAAGRSGSRPVAVPRQLRVVDRLIGELRLLAGDAQPYTLVESAPHGWWYSAPLPGRRLLVAYMTDGDLRTADDWNRRLAETESTRQRVAACAAADGTLRIVSAASRLRQPVAGANWLAAGDAAAAFDPLSGQGIYKSIDGGIRAAEAIIACRGGSRASLTEYAEWVEVQFNHYLQMRTAFYAMETRWRDLPFWARRLPRD